jgi:hypothetical protein
MRRLLALVVKDLYIYRRELVLAWVGITGMTWGMFQMIRPSSPTRALVFICSLDLAVMVGFGDWLSYYEKSKGTFAWIRTLPVSDELVVSSKFMANSIIQIGAFFLPVLLTMPVLLRLDWAPWTLTAWLAVLAMASFMLFTKLAMSRRLGQAVPFIAAFSIILILMQLAKRFPSLLEELMYSVWTPPILLLLECLTIFGIWYLMCRWISAKDTPQLVD